MSIRDVINVWLGSEIFHLQTSLSSAPLVRSVFVSKGLHDDLANPWTDTSKEGVLLARARQGLDGFTEGLAISVRMPPSKSVLAQAALLEPRGEEIWEFRYRDPRPGLRIFGRFAERDCFVALTRAFRKDLQTQDDWTRETEDCKREWRRLFQTHPPHFGIKHDDYVSRSFPV